MKLDTLIDVMSFLKKVSLFEDLSIDQLSLIARIVREEIYPDEAMLIKEGEKNDKLYIIKEGFIELNAEIKEEQQGTLGILTTPSFFGEDGIFNNNPSPVTAQVLMGEARMMTIEGEELKQLMRNHPEIAIGLLSSTIGRLHQSQKRMLKSEA